VNIKREIDERIAYAKDKHLDNLRIPVETLEAWRDALHAPSPTKQQRIAALEWAIASLPTHQDSYGTGDMMPTGRLVLEKMLAEEDASS
jgi:hypothetical protein